MQHFPNFPTGQDLLTPNASSTGADMNSGIRLVSPLTNQHTGATLTITNDQLLPQSSANPGMAGEDFDS